MRQLFVVLSLTFGILFSVGLVGLSGQDVAGTWILAVDLGASGAGDATFVLEQDGNDLSGTYSGALGEQRVSRGWVVSSFTSRSTSSG